MYEADMDPYVIWYTHAASIKEYNLLFRIFLLCFGANLLILFENYCETKLEINWISEKGKK